MKQKEDEIKGLLDLLDEKLAAGEIDETHYDTLRKKYEAELEKVKHEKIEEKLLAEAEAEKREREEKTRMIDCPNCQREIPSDAQLCPYCGTTISPYFVPGKHTGLGITSMILGIISVVFWVIPLIVLFFVGDEDFAGWWTLLLPFPMSILNTLFGSISYFGKARDNYGLVGVILGIIILISSIISMIIIAA